jgi:uncharacterized integral membrane protein
MAIAKSSILTGLSVVFAVAAVLLVAQNWAGEMSVMFLAKSWGPYPQGLVLLKLFALGALAGLCLYWNSRTQYNREIKHFELRREKAEVKAEASTDQVRVLESKIQTLEKALEQALSSGSTTKKDRS